MNAAEFDPQTPEEPKPEPELELVPPPKQVAFDERRPWPLGLPAAHEVLQAITALAEVDEPLQAAHLRVLSMLPEHLYDAARTSLAGAEDPVAAATASAWRVLVAVERSNLALGVDHASLQALIDEGVEARETLLAAGYFALDGGASADELMAALGEAIEQLARLAAFKAKPRPERTGTDTRLLSFGAAADPEAVRGRPLRWVFAATMLFTAAFHLVGIVGQQAPAPWVVVGDVDRGRAFVAPGSAAADDASLKTFLSQLEAQGLSATKAATGEWVLQRRQAAP
ncbi:MAG: hypothetical protein Q8L48_37440 [Archangium sp.]|nr:hypothetical protein [Archangium sp.]